MARFFFLYTAVKYLLQLLRTTRRSYARNIKRESTTSYSNLRHPERPTSKDQKLHSDKFMATNLDLGKFSTDARGVIAWIILVKILEFLNCLTHQFPNY